MANLTISSNKVVLRSVDVQVQFTITNTPATGSTVQYEMCELGKFAYDFDMTTDIDDVDKIGIRAGAISMSFFDNLDATDYPSMYEAIFSSTTAMTVIEATIFLYNPSGSLVPYSIPCRFGYHDVSYDINARKTTINFQPLKPSDYTDYTTLSSLITANPNSVQIYSDVLDGGSDDGMIVENFIETMLDEIYGSSLVSKVIITDSYDTNPSDSDYTWFIFNNKQDLEADELTPAEHLANIAGVEGAVFGDMLGVRCYFVRNLYDTTVSMSESDFSDLKLESTTERKYARLVVEHGSLSATTTPTYYTQPKEAVFSFRFGNVSRRQVWVASTNSLRQATANNTELATVGKDAYDRAINDVYTPRISGTILGATKIKPYECMSIGFGTSGTSRLIGALDGIYRFSSLRYDFFNDSIDFTAYKIDDIA